MGKLEHEMNLDAVLELGAASAGEFADRVINAETLPEELESGPFFLRKDFCEFLGIGESTLTGWLKADRIPRSAKVAYALLVGMAVLQEEVRRLRRETGDPKVLKDGERYLVAQFPSAAAARLLADNADVPAGKIAEIMAGKIVARDIADAKTAQQLAASSRAFELLREGSSTLEDARDYVEETWFRNDVTRVQQNISSWGQALGLLDPDLPPATEQTSGTGSTGKPAPVDQPEQGTSEGDDRREGDR